MASTTTCTSNTCARVSSSWIWWHEHLRHRAPHKHRPSGSGVPAIGEVPQIPGFILAAGFSGHGFGIGPGAGHLIADLVTGAEPIFDPAPYRPDRFSKAAWGKVADF